jgi:hypothetical protein
MIVLTITGCTGPGGLFGNDNEIEERFVYDLTIEDLWNDIPENKTSASDIINFTYELEKSPRITNFTEIGYSIKHQPLLLLEFGNYDSTVPTVYFVAAQHGNEPASVDSAYLMVRHFARGIPEEIDPILDNINLAILVMVNPDGRDNNTRGNSNGTDLNRDHMKLLEPEGKAMHSAFNNLHPSVTVDMHEFGGIGSVIFQVAAPQNPATHHDILLASYNLESVVLDSISDEWGLGSVTNYPPTTSSQDSSIHRNHFAVHGSTSLLFESAVSEGYSERVKLQTWAALAVIDDVTNNPDYYLEARQSSDDEGQEGNDFVYAYLFECSDPESTETIRILKDHGFNLGVKSDNNAISSIHYETFLPKSNFPNGTVVVPMNQIGWRSIGELMEYTSDKDQHYTNSPKDRGMDAWRALESVDFSLQNDVCTIS